MGDPYLRGEDESPEVSDHESGGTKSLGMLSGG